jgi:hypothetical protein
VVALAGLRLVRAARPPSRPRARRRSRPLAVRERRPTCGGSPLPSTTIGVSSASAAIRRTALPEIGKSQPSQAAGAPGSPRSAPVHVLVNGSAVSEDPRQIPLTPHAVIQLSVGGDVPFQPFSSPTGL